MTEKAAYYAKKDFLAALNISNVSDKVYDQVHQRN